MRRTSKRERGGTRERLDGRFLGVIALATLATAIMQIAVLVAAGRLARRMERFVGPALD